MRDFRTVFNRFGENYDATMPRFMDNEKSYLKFFTIFFEDKSLPLLKKALAAKDYNAAFSAAHTLKGISANMGLSRLYAASCAIVEPLRKNDEQFDYQAAFADLEREYTHARLFYEALKESAK